MRWVPMPKHPEYGNTDFMMHDDDSIRDVALLFARGVLGASIAAHGAQKLFGWFGGPGLEGATGFMKSLGFSDPAQAAKAGSITEIAAGTLIATGTFGPVGPALLCAVMTTAVATVHFKNGYWNTDQGFELNTMYALAAGLLALNGYGRLSVDRPLGLYKRRNSLVALIGLAAGVGGGIFMASQRGSQSESTHADEETPRAAGEMGTAGAPAQNVIPDL